MLRTISQIVILCALLFGMAVSDRSASANSQRYESCTRAARETPGEALKLADQWIQEENNASAFHCRALALFALDRYEEAARALETLSFVVTESNPTLWANILQQAGKAWQLAREKDKAIIALTKAIKHTAGNALDDPAIAPVAAGLLYDRSQLYLAGGRNLFALNDLDHAINLNGDDTKLLLARGQLLLALEEYSLASQDAKVILSLNPNHPEAQALQKASALLAKQP